MKSLINIIFISILSVTSLFITACNNSGTNKTSEKELNLQKRELDLKEKELKLKEKELTSAENNSANSKSEIQEISKKKNTQQSNANLTEQQDNTVGFYIIAVNAVKTEVQAKSAAQVLENNGYASGYLWIPDYQSLSGAELYSVYIGPYSTQYECEVATEDYRNIQPDAYGLLVSQQRKRVQINGIGKVKTKNQ